MTVERFTPLQRGLHWLMAVCILAMLFIGVGMVSTIEPKYLTLVSIHKPLGMAIFILALIRLAVRLRSGAPPLPMDLPEPMKLAAHLSHYLLYILMITMPLIGWGTAVGRRLPGKAVGRPLSSLDPAAERGSAHGAVERAFLSRVPLFRGHPHASRGGAVPCPDPPRRRLRRDGAGAHARCGLASGVIGEGGSSDAGARITAPRSSSSFYCKLLGSKLPSEDAAAGEGVREPSLFRDHLWHGWAVGAAFDPPGFVVEPLDRGEPFVVSELRLLHRCLQHLDRLVIDFDRHREWMPVLAAMGEREASGIGETVGRAVHDLGHHRQRAHRAGADARNEKQLGEVGRPPIRGRREARMQARREHVARAHIMMSGHDEMRQNELLRMGRRRGVSSGGLQVNQFARQPSGPSDREARAGHDESRPPDDL